MTPAAADTLALLERLTATRFARWPDGDSIGIQSANGRYLGVIGAPGTLDLRDRDGGEPGVPVRLLDDGRGGWGLVRDRPTE